MRFSGMTVFAVLASVFATSFFISHGVSAQPMRKIYPTASQEESVSIMHASASEHLLKQSGMENAPVHKSNKVVVTPSSYLSGSGNVPKLRRISVRGSFPSGHELLCYFVSEAIPSINETTGQNTFKIAMANRIKQCFLMMIQEVNGWRTGYLNMSLAR